MQLSFFPADTANSRNRSLNLCTLFPSIKNRNIPFKYCSNSSKRMSNSQFNHDDITSQFHSALADSVSLALSNDPERLRSISRTSTIATSADHGFEPNVNEDDNNNSEPKTWRQRISHLYEKESLLIEVTLAIVFAKIYPQLGAVYLFPEITAHWIAVVIIFCKYMPNAEKEVMNGIYFNRWLTDQRPFHKIESGKLLYFKCSSVRILSQA